MMEVGRIVPQDSGVATLRTIIIDPGCAPDAHRFVHIRSELETYSEVLYCQKCGRVIKVRV